MHGAVLGAGGGGGDGALVPGVAGGGNGLDIGDGIALGAVDGLAAVLGAGGSLVNGVIFFPGVAGGVNAPGLRVLADGADALLTAVLGAGGGGDGGPGAKGVAGGGNGLGVVVAARRAGIGAHAVGGAGGGRGDRVHIAVGQLGHHGLGHDHGAAHGAVAAIGESGLGAGGGNGGIGDNGVGLHGNGLGPGGPTQLAGVGAHAFVPLVLTGGAGDGDRAGDRLVRHGGGKGGVARRQGGELTVLHLYHVAARRHGPAGLHVHVDLRRPGVVGIHGGGHGGQVCLLPRLQGQGGDGAQGDAADGAGGHPDVHGGVGGRGGRGGVGIGQGTKLLHPEIHPAIHHMGDANGGHVLGEHIAAVALAGVVLIVLPPGHKDVLSGGVADGDVLRCAAIVCAQLAVGGVPVGAVRAGVAICDHDLGGPLHGHPLQVVVIGECLELAGEIGFCCIILIPVPSLVAGTEVVDQRQHLSGVGLGIGDIQLDVDVGAGGKDRSGAGEHKHGGHRQGKTSANQLFHDRYPPNSSIVVLL